ncbi:MAG: TRAP transporter substrate-binding protein DctP [Desulfomonile tiedjei]|nr:TRAP transporter substrate-binding protein DctP [Desulfomonile tiedjei]
MFKKAVVAVMAFLAFGLFPLAPAFGQTTLRFYCAYPEKSYTGQSTLFFANEVARLTTNQVQVKVSWPGKDVKIGEVFDAVCQGELDGYSGSLVYFAGKMPEVNCQWLPFNWANANDAKDVLINKGYMNVMAEAAATHGVTYLGALSAMNMGFLTKFPVAKIGDLKGKKIRSAGGILSEEAEALGASAVDLPAPDQYEALKSGRLDGTDFPWYAVEGYKLSEVVSYLVRPALHTPGVLDIIVNTKILKSLPPDQQQAVRKAAMNTMEQSFALSDARDEDALRKAESLGVTVSVIPEFQLVKFRGAMRPLWNREAKKSPHSAKLVEILREHLRKSMGVEQ